MKDGKPNGQGISYYENGNKWYEGKWIDGNRNGKGIAYYEGGDKRYEGEWKDGKRHGKGISTMIDGRSYIEEYENGILKN